MGNFKITEKPESSAIEIVFIGSVDEAFKFPAVDAKFSKLFVDLDHVSYVSSFGVKNWVSWVATLPKTIEVEFSRARYSVISNVNSVHGFLPTKCKIKSLYAPFIDSNGNDSVEILLEEGKHFFQGGKLALPEIINSSGNKLEIDVVEAKFFRFLKP